MSGHFVICGFGQVGYRVANLLLDLGKSVTILTLDARDQWVREVEQRGVRILVGDARDYDLLRETHPEDAAAVLALTSNDPANLEVALDVKSDLPDARVVARIFDQTLAEHATQSLGVDRALAMSVEAAPAFASAAVGDRVVSEFEHAGRTWTVSRVMIEEGHAWIGRDTAEVQFGTDFGIVLHVSADGTVTGPDGAARIRAGDTIKVLARSDHPDFAAKVEDARPSLGRETNPFRMLNFARKIWRNSSKELRGLFLGISLLILVSIAIFQVGMKLSTVDALYYVITTVTTTGYGDITPKESAIWVKLYCCLIMILGSAVIAVLYSIVTDYVVTARLQQFAGSYEVPERDHVVVMGLGDVGYRVVERLLSLRVPVVVVDSSPDTKYLQAIRRRAAVVVGDAREPETLDAANIATARSFVGLTGVDAVNLSAGLLAKERNPAIRTVLRIFDGNFADKIQKRLAVEHAKSASFLAAPAFVGAALDPTSLHSFVLRERLITLSPPDPNGQRTGQQLLEIGTDTRFAVTVRRMRQG